MNSIVLKLNLYCPNLSEGHRNGLSVRELSENVLELPEFSSYSKSRVISGILECFQTDENYKEYYDRAYMNNALSSQKHLRDYHDKKGNVLWEGKLYDDALRLKISFGTKRGTNEVISRILNYKYFEEVDRLKPSMVGDFCVREKRKGNLPAQIGLKLDELRKEAKTGKRKLLDWEREYESQQYGKLPLIDIASCYLFEDRFKGLKVGVRYDRVAELLKRDLGLKRLSGSGLQKVMSRYKRGDKKGRFDFKSSFLDEMLRVA